MICLLGQLHAQKISNKYLTGDKGSLIKTEELDGNPMGRRMEVIGNDYYLLSNMSIIKFSSINRIEYAKKIEFALGRKRLKPWQLIVSNGNIYAIVVDYDDNAKMDVLYKATVDKATGTLGTPEKIYEEKGVCKTRMHVAFSPDSSQVLIACYLGAVIQGIPLSSLEADIFVLDRDLKLQWHQHDKQDVKTFTQMSIDNDGRVAAYSSERQSGVLYFWNKPGEPQVLALNFKANYLEMEFNSDEVLSGCVLYAKSSLASWTDGLYFFTVDANGKRVSSKLDYEFPMSLASDGRLVNRKVDNPSLPYLAIKKIIPDNQGGALVITEGQSPDYMTHSSIYAFSINKGKMEWATAIPKYQRVKVTMASLSIAAKGNNVYLIYNDDPDNFSRNDHNYKTFSNGTGSDQVLVTLDEKGSYTKTKIGTNDNLVMWPFVSTFDASGKGAIICGPQRPDFNKWQLMTLDLK